MDTWTEENWFYNLSYAICYSYGTDKKRSHYSTTLTENICSATRSASAECVYGDILATQQTANPITIFNISLIYIFKKLTSAYTQPNSHVVRCYA